MKLTVQNAEIKTATVEVKTLTISGKQVTLAVFRQLKEADLICDDGTFNGVPWGTVNYHPDKCSGPQHLHVVWQNGVELRRAYVEPPWFPQEIWAESGGEWLDAALLDDWKPKGDERVKSLLVDFVSGSTAIQVDEPAADLMWDSSWWDEDRRQKKRAEALEQIRGRVTLDRGQLTSLVDAEISSELKRRKRHQARWTELLDLPQLFIAV